MSHRIRDGLGRVRLLIPEGFDSSRPIFVEPPDDLDETWRHGGIAGGMAWLTPQMEVAQAYRFAASAVIKQALRDDLAWQAVYPALFLYRHAIEVTLKALFPGAPFSHGLKGLIDRVGVLLDANMNAEDAAWVKARLHEFEVIDPASTAFRYTGAKLPGEKHLRQDGEWWVDFVHLRDVMEIVLEIIEVMAWDENAAVEER